MQSSPFLFALRFWPESKGSGPSLTPIDKALLQSHARLPVAPLSLPRARPGEGKGLTLWVGNGDARG